MELGHFGQLINDEPRSVGLAAGFPVIAPVALSFRLLGVGAWQGRLPFVLFTLGSLALLYFLATRTYDHRVAVGTLLVLFLLPVSGELHPLLVGRQVLGEMPSLFFLFAGYASLWLALKRNGWFILLAVFLWGIALRTKMQIPPFWLASLLLPLIASIYKRWWNAIIYLVVGIVASYLLSKWVLAPLQISLITGRVLHETPVNGLYDVTAMVLDWNARRTAIVKGLTFGAPVLFGLGSAFISTFNNLRLGTVDPNKETLRLSLLGLGGGWFIWFISLAIFWDRYLFPAFFVSSIFSANFLNKATGGFNIRWIVASLIDGLSYKGFTWSRLRQLLVVTGRLFVIAWCMVASLVTISVLLLTYLFLSSDSAEKVAGFLNQNILAGSLVETYESELFYQLDRPYHYPPDQIHVELNRRKDLSQDVPIDYDPLQADPDYLVVGPFSRMWDLYDPVISTGEFRLIKSFPSYQIYERAR